MDHTLFQSPNATTSGISLTIWLPELLAICFSNASWKDSKASSQIGTYLDQNEELKPSWCDYTFMGFRRFNPIRPLFQDALSINTSVICCTPPFNLKTILSSTTLTAYKTSQTATSNYIISFRFWSITLKNQNCNSIWMFWRNCSSICQTSCYCYSWSSGWIYIMASPKLAGIQANYWETSLGL